MNLRAPKQRRPTELALMMCAGLPLAAENSSSPAAGNVEPTSSPFPEEPAVALAAVYGPVMRSGASEAAPLERPFRAPTLSVLDPLSFAWVRIGDGQNGEDRFPFTHCLVQMPASFPPDMDTKDPTVLVQMSWWKPENAAKGGYGGKWVVWLNGKSQWVAPVRRGTIEFTDVQVWPSSISTGPLGGRWVKVQKKSLVLPEP